VISDTALVSVMLWVLCLLLIIIILMADCKKLLGAYRHLLYRSVCHHVI